MSFSNRPQKSMSLKQRAAQCSGHVPERSYVPAPKLATPDRRRVKWQDPPIAHTPNSVASSIPHENTKTLQSELDLSSVTKQDHAAAAADLRNLSSSSPASSSSSDDFSSVQGSDFSESYASSCVENGSCNSDETEQVLSRGHGSSPSAGLQGSLLNRPPLKQTPDKFGAVTQDDPITQNDKASNLPTDEPQQNGVAGLHPCILPDPFPEDPALSGNVPSWSKDLDAVLAAVVAASINEHIHISSNTDDQSKCEEESQDMPLGELNEDRSLTSSVSESCHREEGNLGTAFCNTDHHNMASEHERLHAETEVVDLAKTQGDAVSDESTVSRSRITEPELESVPAIAELPRVEDRADSLDRESTKLLQASCGNKRNEVTLPRPSSQSQRVELDADNGTTPPLVSHGSSNLNEEILGRALEGQRLREEGTQLNADNATTPPQVSHGSNRLMEGTLGGALASQALSGEGIIQPGLSSRSKNGKLNVDNHIILCPRTPLGSSFVNKQNLGGILQQEAGIQPGSSCNNSSRESIDDSSRKQVLDKVRRDKIMAKAFAYQEAKNAQFENRYRPV
eukprot:c20540_g1_i1 orf=842-2542(-)